ncbi:hypothetical protein [Paenibacillus monticola]|uniref:Uncharacterized protein n=1 Tax=Paenibacillus monticola TaxID=2666075 RepID=A0A7X2L0Y8_9BACL|nr:hypothetical protein [Paenibacillus monticola]MRN52555.1 hypothetical protein [Paenibacillus monticola]
MRFETDLLVRQHTSYMSQPENAAEARKFETLVDHMFHYFFKVLGMTEAEARAVIDDFESSFSKVPYEVFCLNN